MRRIFLWTGLAAAALGIAFMMRVRSEGAPATRAREPDVTASTFGRDVSPFAAVRAGTSSSRAVSPMHDSARPDVLQTSAVDPPEGVSSDEWQQLKERLRDHPRREQELARIADYLSFSHQVQVLRDLKAHGTSADLIQTARRVDLSLDAHLQRGELSAGEAALLKAEVIETLEPDQVRREQLLTRWRHEHGAPSAAMSADPRAQEYRRREAALVAAWQALPQDQRDSAQLQSQLDALRLAVFASPRSP